MEQINKEKTLTFLGCLVGTENSAESIFLKPAMSLSPKCFCRVDLFFFSTSVLCNYNFTCSYQAIKAKCNYSIEVTV